MFEESGWIKAAKFLALQRFPEEQREKVKDVLEGKEVIIEHHVRHGKVVCHFIPILADEIIRKQFRREEPPVIYQCGSATREAHEKQVIKKMKSGASPEELIDDFIKREETEGITFFEPAGDIAKAYFFSEELIKLLPDFLNYLVEKLDVSRICLELDEHQTLDFVRPETAQHALRIKELLVEDFLAKHANDEEVKRALRIQQGGARKRKGFAWRKKEKVAFYQKVESLPKKDDKSYMQYALDTLIEQEFDAETISWLKSRPMLKDVSDVLFNEAIKTWRKYLLHENWKEMKAEEKPLAFEYRHVLNLLDYPDKYTFSTLDTHYYIGKKLSDLQK
ncbi:MAG: hypothetical protein QOD28_1114 [Acidobacteriota bacterium]|nr:hypothetical protein [Acidobacteriota bacterium]